MSRKLIGERIKDFLKDKDMTQADLAEQLGMAKSAVSEMLSGKRNPTSLAERIAEVYEVDKALFIVDSLQNEKENTKPRLPVTAAAGHLSEYVEGVMRHQCEEIPIVRVFPSYDFTMIIRGNSMEPKYEGGDEIALRKANIIEWGKEYVLDTEDGAIFKRIYDEGDNIRCVSYNSEEYPDFLVPKSSIYGFYKQVGLLRFSV